MKLLKGILYTLAILGALAAFGWYFVSGLGSRPADGLAGVMLAPPPDYAVVERGELSTVAAAAELEARVQRGGKVGLHFQRGGSEVYWLADVSGDLLEERSAGPGGTRLQTIWKGNLRERLRWGQVHGDFTMPGLPPPERKNLYH